MPLFLRTMGDVKDGGQMLLTPVDGIRETADKHQDGIRVDGVKTTNLVFIGQLQRVTVVGLTTI